MVDVLRLCIPRWDLVRAALALGSHAFLIYCVLAVLCLWPGKAFALSGYSRVMTVAQWNAMWSGPSQVARVSSIGSAISAMGTPASIAVRAVTGPLGWAALGVAAGIAIGEIYYPQAKVADIKSATDIPGPWSIPGSSVSISGNQCPGGGQACVDPAIYDQVISINGCSGSPGVAGWQFYQATGTSPNTVCYYRHIKGNNSTLATQGASSPASGPQIASYLNGLPANDPHSVPSNTQPLGLGSSPATADQTTVEPLSTTQAQTTVVPTTQKPAGSTTLDDNATPPAGTQTTTTDTQSNTTTTTTTTNPDGSTTQQDTSSGSVSCASGQHDDRTFGNILQSHIDTWKGSGILGQVALLQSLTWPTALPTITLTSSTWGTHHINFNDWSAMFTALRAIVIAGAGFAAYRIVFVGGGS